VPAYVFGYGSLAARAADGRPARLLGRRRSWGVAMDNTRTIPGYKYYVDAATGTRPEVFVAFLDLRPGEDGDAVNGIVFPVTEGELAELDRRERNYRRVEVTGAVIPPPAGRVWTYAGNPEAKQRRDRGLAVGTLVVDAGYVRLVAEGFTALGAEELDRYRASTDEPPGPLAELRRIDLA
jgi:dephospho-CoA kinase